MDLDGYVGGLPGRWRHRRTAEILPSTAPAGFYSSNRLGRCVQNTAGSVVIGAARIEIARNSCLKPSSQAVSTRRRPTVRENDLDARVSVKETPEWRHERITFKGANGERAIAYAIAAEPARPLQILRGARRERRAAYETCPRRWKACSDRSSRLAIAAFGVVLKELRR
jgi:hypothetical protein